MHRHRHRRTPVHLQRRWLPKRLHRSRLVLHCCRGCGRTLPPATSCLEWPCSLLHGPLQAHQSRCRAAAASLLLATAALLCPSAEWMPARAHRRGCCCALLQRCAAAWRSASGRGLPLLELWPALLRFLGPLQPPHTDLLPLRQRGRRSMRRGFAGRQVAPSTQQKQVLRQIRLHRHSRWPMPLQAVQRLQPAGRDVSRPSQPFLRLCLRRIPATTTTQLLAAQTTMATHPLTATRRRSVAATATAMRMRMRTHPAQVTTRAMPTRRHSRAGTMRTGTQNWLSLSTQRQQAMTMQ